MSRKHVISDLEASSERACMQFSCQMEGEMVGYVGSWCWEGEVQSNGDVSGMLMAKPQ